MSLKEKLQADLKRAMKEKDKISKSVVTLIRSAILQYEKDNKVELKDEEITGIIAKQLKQNKDVLKDFQKANRQDLIEQTEKEIEILTNYLPRQLTEEEVSKIVTDTIGEVGATSMNDMGKVMSAVMPKVKGKADGGIVSKVVKEKLK